MFLIWGKYEYFKNKLRLSWAKFSFNWGWDWMNFKIGLVIWGLLVNRSWSRNFFWGGGTLEKIEKMTSVAVGRAKKIDGFSYVFKHIMKKLEENLKKSWKDMSAPPQSIPVNQANQLYFSTNI